MNSNVWLFNLSKPERCETINFEVKAPPFIWNYISLHIMQSIVWLICIINDLAFLKNSDSPPQHMHSTLF